jgi:anti-sigma factor ChrR (cupin superfamily)
MTMLNMDFTQRVVIDTQLQDWVASPRAGVWRKPLAREEAERGHATSVVRYDPGASFSSHDHPLGEEILVLEGTFSDETGDYKAGTYFRNPEGFRHAPFSEEGCVILVKLHQFAKDDDGHVCINTRQGGWQSAEGNLQVLPLHEFGSESVVLAHLLAGLQIPTHEHVGGEELYVISGEIIDEYGRFGPGNWIRSPNGSQHTPFVEVDTLVWAKAGHL